MKKLNGAIRRLTAMNRALRGADEMLLGAAEAVRAQAAALAPVKTGRLRNSLEVRRSGNGASVIAACPYAALVELGASRRAPTPFLLPAARMKGAEAARESVRRALENAK